MNLRCQNMYQSARESAGLTQESAAELLGISTKSVQCYEAAHTIPPAGMVQKMVLVYGAAWLGNSYCNGCPLGMHRSLPESQLDVQQLAIEIGLAFGTPEQFRRDATRMLEISLDRQISDAEIKDYNEITERFWRCGLIAEKMRIVLAMQR